MEENLKLDYFLLDGKTLEKVLNKYSNKLIGFINSFVSNFNSSEDLMMDVFVEVLQRKPKFENEMAFKGYLYKCAKNKAINYIKKNNRYSELNEELLEDTHNLEDELYNNYTKKVLIETILQLKMKYRTVLYLSILEEMENVEICEIMNLNERQVRNLKNRAKTKLNKLLKNKNLFYKN